MTILLEMSQLYFAALFQEGLTVCPERDELKFFLA